MNDTKHDDTIIDVETVTFTTVKVSILGRLDAARCLDLRPTFDRLVADGCNRLVVDLTDVEFVDSVGLAALVKVMRDSEGIGAEFQVIRPRSEDAMRVFRLTKFDEVMSMNGPT